MQGMFILGKKDNGYTSEKGAFTGRIEALSQEGANTVLTIRDEAFFKSLDFKPLTQAIVDLDIEQRQTKTGSFVTFVVRPQGIKFQKVAA